jgi:hypothetical protein
MKRYNTFVSRLGAGFIDGLAPESQPDAVVKSKIYLA